MTIEQRVQQVLASYKKTLIKSVVLRLQYKGLVTQEGAQVFLLGL
jgi:hypothetical protein